MLGQGVVEGLPRGERLVEGEREDEGESLGLRLGLGLGSGERETEGEVEGEGVALLLLLPGALRLPVALLLPVLLTEAVKEGVRLRVLRALRERGAREGVGAAEQEGEEEGAGDCVPVGLGRGEVEEEGQRLGAAVGRGEREEEGQGLGVALSVALALGVPPAPPAPLPTEAVRRGDWVLGSVQKVTTGLTETPALAVRGEAEAVPLTAPLALLLPLLRELGLAVGLP